MTSVKLSLKERNYLDKLIEESYNGVIPSEDSVKELINKAKEIYIKEENVQVVHAQSSSCKATMSRYKLFIYGRLCR